MPIDYFYGRVPRMFRWAGLYEVTLRTDRELGMFRLTPKYSFVFIEVWNDGQWVFCADLCIPDLRRLPKNVPFTAETEWLRKATTKETARLC